MHSMVGRRGRSSGHRGWKSGNLSWRDLEVSEPARYRVARSQTDRGAGDLVCERVAAWSASQAACGRCASGCHQCQVRTERWTRTIMVLSGQRASCKGAVRQQPDACTAGKP